MDFPEIINFVTSFAKANPLIVFAIVLFLAFLMWLKPKFFFTVLLLSLLLAGVFYVIMEMATSARSEKMRLLEKPQSERPY